MNDEWQELTGPSWRSENGFEPLIAVLVTAAILALMLAPACFSGCQ